MSSKQKFAYVWTRDLGGWRDRLDELGAEGDEITGQWPADTGTVFVLTCITGVLTPVGAQPEAGSEQKFYAASLDRDGVCVRCGDMAPSVDKVPDGHRLDLYAEQLFCPHEPVCAAVQIFGLDCTCGAGPQPATCVNAREGAQEAQELAEGPWGAHVVQKTAESERQEPQETLGEASSEGRTPGEQVQAAQRDVAPLADAAVLERMEALVADYRHKCQAADRHASCVDRFAARLGSLLGELLGERDQAREEALGLSLRTEETWLLDAVNHACDVMSDRLLGVWDEVLQTGERHGVFGGDKLERVAQLLATAALNERDRRLGMDTPLPAPSTERPQGTASTERRYAILRSFLWRPLSHAGRGQALKELDELVWLLRKERDLVLDEADQHVSTLCRWRTNAQAWRHRCGKAEARLLDCGIELEFLGQRPLWLADDGTAIQSSEAAGLHEGADQASERPNEGVQDA
jgi:hypothetical protein